MLSNTSGDVNTAVGENSLISNTIGRYNTAIGVQAQEQNTTGAQNTAIGVAAIDRNTAGNYNAVLGAFSGRYVYSRAMRSLSKLVRGLYALVLTVVKGVFRDNSL